MNATNNTSALFVILAVLTVVACNDGRDNPQVSATSVEYTEDATSDPDPIVDGFEEPIDEDEFVCVTSVTLSYTDSDGLGQIVAEAFATRESGTIEETSVALTSGGQHAFSFEFVDSDPDPLDSFEFIMLEDGTQIGADARFTVRIQYTIDPEFGRACGRIGFHRSAAEVSEESGDVRDLSWSDDFEDETGSQDPRSYIQNSIDLEQGDLLWIMFE